MSAFFAKLAAFAATPAGAFVIDLVDAAVVGAATVAVALPDDVSAKGALVLIAGGAIGFVKASARVALVRFLAARAAPSTPTPTP